MKQRSKEGAPPAEKPSSPGQSKQPLSLHMFSCWHSPRGRGILACCRYGIWMLRGQEALPSTAVSQSCDFRPSLWDSLPQNRGWLTVLLLEGNLVVTWSQPFTLEIRKLRFLKVYCSLLCKWIYFHYRCLRRLPTVMFPISVIHIIPEP